MKNIKLLTLTCIVFLYTITVFGQRKKELKCFDNFEYDNSGKSRINAYLLAMLNYNMYPQNLLGVEYDTETSNDLSQNNTAFLNAFKNKMEPWFLTDKLKTQTLGTTVSIRGTGDKNVLKKVQQPLNITTTSKPVIEFLHESNGAGYDPEVMLISTDDYIILAWRGTDRVSSDNTLMGKAIFEAGEWFQTDFDFPLVSAPSGIPGRVHRGFNSSINYNGLINRIANRLVELDVNTKKLWITGHSLGGAHAQLSALYLKEQHNIQPFAVYGYAAPGVGDQRFCNAIEAAVPGSKLQRFIYIYDPVPRVPASILSGMQDYARAGQLNYYSSEQGSKNYEYNYKTEPKYPGPFVCHHHPQWYARAAFFELLDKNPEYNNKVPDAPSMPTQGCTPLDQQLAEGNGNFLQSFLGIHQDMEAGTYYIINYKTGLYLNLKSNDFAGNGKSIRIGPHGSSNRFKWRITNIPQSPLGGYVITSKIVDKVIEAKFGDVGEQNSRVQTWDRWSSAIPVRTHQEWEIKRLNNGRFHIKNMKNRRFMLRATNNGRIVLDDNTAISSQWYFVKI